MSKTNEPTFCGLPWSTIQAMQQGTYRPAPFKITGKKPATDQDQRLLAEHGEQGLRDRQLYGVLDRLNLPAPV